ncbi:MAG: hypothetical protein QM817_12615 [Archangium sp.]
MAALVRVMPEIGESSRTELTDTTFTSRAFSVHRSSTDWVLQPTRGPLLLNAQTISKPTALRDDDVFVVGMDSWIFQAGTIARNEALEVAALNDPSGDAWRVLGDWLLEHGDCLGHRIAAGGNAEQMPLWPIDDFDARLFDEGVVEERAPRFECDERHGLVSRLIVRSMNHATLNDRLGVVLRLSRLRFVREVVLDVELAVDRERALAVWTRRLSDIAFPSSLERLHLGHVRSTTGFGELGPPLKLRVQCSRLVAEPLIRPWRRAQLLLNGTAQEIQPGYVLERRDGELSVHAGPALDTTSRHYQFAVVGERWRLQNSELSEGIFTANVGFTRQPLAVSIAGWRVGDTTLLDGDRLEIRDHGTARFQLRG